MSVSKEDFIRSSFNISTTIILCTYLYTSIIHVTSMGTIALYKNTSLQGYSTFVIPKGPPFLLVMNAHVFATVPRRSHLLLSTAGVPRGIGMRDSQWVEPVEPIVDNFQLAVDSWLSKNTWPARRQSQSQPQCQSQPQSQSQLAPAPFGAPSIVYIAYLLYN